MAAIQNKFPVEDAIQLTDRMKNFLALLSNK